eukprot:TRINITY_DN19215_c0_g1_i1.p1 TRINITY_DN19215_c0_g1~~TRINITY_DN19215_c0_g1_i1.p1  ORF type:complete len:104 (+),score=16.96 TRINITY_DN19215_c0_g1_i1:171-482(+)
MRSTAEKSTPEGSSPEGSTPGGPTPEGSTPRESEAGGLCTGTAARQGIEQLEQRVDGREEECAKLPSSVSALHQQLEQWKVKHKGAYVGLLSEEEGPFREELS